MATRWLQRRCVRCKTGPWRRCSQPSGLVPFDGLSSIVTWAAWAGLFWKEHRKWCVMNHTSARSFPYHLFDLTIDIHRPCLIQRFLMIFVVREAMRPDKQIRLKPHGLVCGGPPCSLFVGASSSIHRRSVFRPLGDLSWLSVRMSNQIWSNTATCWNIEGHFPGLTFTGSSWLDHGSLWFLDVLSIS